MRFGLIGGSKLELVTGGSFLPPSHPTFQCRGTSPEPGGGGSRIAQESRTGQGSVA